MAVRSRSSKLFRERSGLRPTLPSQTPVYGLGDNPAHSLELEPPLPIPELQSITQGNPPTDRGATVEWPNGSLTEN